MHAQGSMEEGLKLPHVRSLESQGWQVQHSLWSFDSLTVYFAAKEPGDASYDLYEMHAEGWKWSAPHRIDALSSSLDEWWPSINSDESAIYFVRRTPADPKEKNSYERTQIYRAFRRNGTWSKAEPIIISGEEDTRPSIAEDSQTMTFYRRAASKKHDGAWQLMQTRVLDEHNWMLPSLCTEPPAVHPIAVVNGTVTQAANGLPLPNAKVYVYDAITRQLLQTANVHKATGRFRVALQGGEQYHIDVTADGFSHQYISRDFRQLEERTVEASTSVVLSSRLQIHLLLYDSETQESLGGEQRSLSIGQIHTIPLQRSGYRDTTLVLNTEREVLFSETEIDIPMTPKKSRHHIEVRDSRTGEPVPNPLIRMDGRVAPPDTSLRLDRRIALQVSAPGYFFYDTLFSSGKSERPRLIHVPLQPIEKDFVLQLRAIQFNTDSYELTDDSDTELEQLLRLMQMNPTLRIELSSHTDDRGTDRYNDRLSTLRGESVARWLISRGIDAGRIRAVGYGKRKPLVANDSDENRALNRRVEIKVVEY